VEDRKAEPAARAQDSGCDQHCAIEVVDVHERHVGQHPVKGPTIPPLVAGGIGTDVGHTERTVNFDPLSVCEHLRGEVDAHDRSSETGQMPAGHPISATLVKDPLTDNIVGQKPFGRSSQRRVNSTYQSAMESYRAGAVAMTKAGRKPACLGSPLCLAISLSPRWTCPTSPAWGLIFGAHSIARRPIHRSRLAW
jgi:hypothetical protein